MKLFRLFSSQLSNRLYPARKKLLKIEDLKHSIIEDLQRLKDSSRIRLKTLPQLSTYLNGLREHEFTILTGPSGSGKTTLLSQISLDYSLQGLSTLWCSFEIKNSRLALTMIEQLTQKSLSTSPDMLISDNLFQDASKTLSNIPLYFYDCYGLNFDLEEFLFSLKNAVQANEIKHVIVDNLQFMLSNSWRGSSDKFDAFERTITALRTFCNTIPVHLTLVVHPRKEDDNVVLGLSSISGTAKATQEADNVLILQRIEGKNFIDIKKNRFAGKLGRIPIEFNESTKEIKEIDKSDSIAIASS